MAIHRTTVDILIAEWERKAGSLIRGSGAAAFVDHFSKLIEDRVAIEQFARSAWKKTLLACSRSG